MKRGNLIAILLLIFILIFLGIKYDFFSRVTGLIVKEENNIADCLNEKSVILFTSDNCPNCEAQRELIDVKTYRDINKVDCYLNPEECSHLQSIPAWSFNTEIVYGIVEFEGIKEEIGC